MIKNVEITVSQTKECAIITTISRDRRGWAEYNDAEITTPYGVFLMSKEESDCVWNFIDRVFKNRANYETITTMHCDYVKKNYVSIHAEIEYTSENHKNRSVTIYAPKEDVLRDAKHWAFVKTLCNV